MVREMEKVNFTCVDALPQQTPAFSPLVNYSLRHFGNYISAIHCCHLANEIKPPRLTLWLLLRRKVTVTQMCFGIAPKTFLDE